MKTKRPSSTIARRVSPKARVPFSTIRLYDERAVRAAVADVMVADGITIDAGAHFVNADW